MKINIDPVAFYVFDLPVRWYALAYIVSIFVGGWVAEMAASRLCRVDKKYINPLINWLVVGIIIGGRLGHVIFYEPDFFFGNPVEILKLWHGGMSFHGGVIGVVIACILFCRKNAINVLDVFDVIAVATPIGLFLGRIANFINGELYGKVWSSEYAFYFSDNLPRHPVQLYEAVLEGAVILLIELIMCFYTRNKPARGHLSGVFCLLYACFRWMCEYFKEADSLVNDSILQATGISVGQYLSIPMFLVGVYLVYVKGRNAKSN